MEKFKQKPDQITKSNVENDDSFFPNCLRHEFIVSHAKRVKTKVDGLSVVYCSAPKKKDVSNANQVVLRACANLVLKHGGLAQLKSGECDQYN